MCAPWHLVVGGVRDAAAAVGVSVAGLDMRREFRPWDEVLELTSTPELADDPNFAKIPTIDLVDLVKVPRLPPRSKLPFDSDAEVLVLVYGPGAALVEHEVLWYADLPKRFAEADVVAGRGRNLGQAADETGATTKRLFYIDWPMLDRHRDAIADRIDRFIDLQPAPSTDDVRPGRDASAPTSISGSVLRRTVDQLVNNPIRTRPTFNTTPWGGQWAKRELGMNPEAENTALGYELIAPESGVLVGDSGSASVEIPFGMIVSMHPRRMLGPSVFQRFGPSFPIRFDYLDTVAGGNLSVHCHPQDGYMWDVFGWPYTQHETYYLMVGGKKNKVFLGLRKHADIDAFHSEADAAARDGVEFDIEQYVQTFPAVPHTLFVVPAGTPHGSGEGNVVLEVSATPYLYSLRFFDWLRRSSDGTQRPVHVEQAFDNLNTRRTGKAVRRDLIQTPSVIGSGTGWTQELLGALPEMFFRVERVVLDGDQSVTLDTVDRFHVLNVVEGEGVLLTTPNGFRQRFAYAETFVVPAVVGSYSLTRIGNSRVRLVKALVT